MIVTTRVHHGVVLRYDSYHFFGATACQWDASGQVCAVIGDGAGGAVELNVFQDDVLQCGHREHQPHLCAGALQPWWKRVGHEEHTLIPAK